MNRSLNKNQVFGKLGNFWNEVIQSTDVDSARSLAHTIDSSAILGQFKAMQNHLAGADEVLIENGYTTFGDADVNSIGIDMQKRVVTTLADGSEVINVITRPSNYDLNLSGLVEVLNADLLETKIKTASCEVIFFPVPDAVASLSIDANEMRERYVLTLKDQDLEILTIQKPGEELISGIDFVSGPGVLVFSSNPFALFPNGELVYRIGRKRKRSINSFSMRADCLYGAPSYVASYYRENQSPKSFERAIAQAAGLVVVTEDAKIRKVFPHCIGATYVTDTNIIHVPYTHSVLNEGTELVKGENIGGLVSVKSRSTHGNTWWRDVDWTNNSLDMTVMSRFGLEIPHAYIAASPKDTNNQVAVEPFYNETVSGARDTFWAFLGRQVEWSSDSKLADLLGLTEEADPDVQVNMFQIAAENFIQNKVLLVELKTIWAGAKYDDAARAFIDREKPAGMLTLIHELDDYEVTPE